jgi:alpha-glucosidase (family GH31 glycosyl hydrolase)
MRWLVAVGVAVATACPGEEPGPWEVGLFTVARDGPRLVVERDGRRLLESALTDRAPYVPVATGSTDATFEMMYGAFRITDGPISWRAGDRLQPDGTWPGVARVTANSPAEGVLLLEVTAADSNVNRTSLAFRCAPGEHFLGFGAQQDGVDHRGHRVPVWTSEPGIGKTDSDDDPDLWFLLGARHASSMGLPTFLSSRGYIVVVENDHRSVFEMCSEREDAWRVEVWDRSVRLWLYDGPSPRDALARATAGVLGRPPRPPPMAFAPWVDAITGSQHVRDVVTLLRQNGIPASAIWTEDFRGGRPSANGSYRLREEWDLDRTLYPDAEELAAELKRDGLAWHAYFNTFLVRGTRVFGEAQEHGYFVKNPAGEPYLFDGVTFVPSGLVDLSSPPAREWLKGYMRRALDVGFSGWMADFGEWLPHDAVLASGEDPLAAHNRYPREWQRVSHEVAAERAGATPPVVYFSRSGWLGSAALSPVFWGGDQRTSFQRDDGLYSVIPLALNLGLAGVSTFGSDIAGYQDGTNPTSTKELFFRWTQLGALSPVMRTHHGVKASLNWWFGKDDETLQHFKRWARFHTSLFPYLDGSSVEAETSGIPLMRTLALHFPDDDVAWTVSDQYMLGPWLLVAPVVEEGAVERLVHFPPGVWMRWDGGAPVTGPTDVRVEAPLTDTVLYAAAGSVVPLLPEDVDTLLPASPPTRGLDDVDGHRVVRVYLGADGAFTERDGTRYTLQGLTSGRPGSLSQDGTGLRGAGGPGGSPGRGPPGRTGSP